MSESDQIIHLHPGWERVKERLDAMGLDGMRLIAARHGYDLGHYSEECEYVPDPMIWSYYRQMPSGKP